MPAAASYQALVPLFGTKAIHNSGAPRRVRPLVRSPRAPVAGLHPDEVSPGRIPVASVNTISPRLAAEMTYYSCSLHLTIYRNERPL